MISRFIRVIGIFGALAASSAVLAADVKMFGKAGIDLGGDTLVRVVFEDGDTQDIDSNNGLFLGGGVSIRNDAKTFETEIALTYKFQTISADNGELTWSRVPVDVLAFYLAEHVRVGGGLTYHMSPKLDGDGVVSGISGEFENSLGYLVQVDWRINESMSVGGRFTFLSYTIEGSSEKAQSNGLGVVFSGRF
jgi:hypothetical protein